MKMDSLSEHNIPWDLIADSLQPDFPAEEDARLQQWLAESTANRETYQRARELWAVRLADFSAYQAADEATAWDSLMQQLQEKTTAPVVIMRSGKGHFIRKWTAIAAVLLVMAAGIVWYLLPDRSEQVYATTTTQREIALPDGSSITMQPYTEVRVGGRYNQHERAVQLIKGEAFFKVIHNANLPFLVNMDESSVKDIGTSFNIRRSPDTIKLAVISGKVAFWGKDNQETRELSAGMSLAYDVVKKNFTEWAPSSDQGVTNRENLLYFDHTVLTDVVKQIEKVYGKKIQLGSTAIGERKLKADLQGLLFDKALQVICTSLNLDYTDKNGIIILKDKENK